MRALGMNTRYIGPLVYAEWNARKEYGWASRENLGVASGERERSGCRCGTLPCPDAPRARAFQLEAAGVLAGRFCRGEIGTQKWPE